MISDRAKLSFDQTFVNSLATSLAAPGDPRSAVRVVREPPLEVHDKVVMLTVSSYGFRLLTLIHFTLDTVTRAHLARIGHLEGTPEDSAVLDIVAECGNICCGTLNRSLGAHFPHTGMSTPNILHARSAAFVLELGGAYVRHFEVVIPDGPTWHASLCVCAHTDLDFTATAIEDASEAAESTGELEMF